jgi:hypothetical protein
MACICGNLRRHRRYFSESSPERLYPIIKTRTIATVTAITAAAITLALTGSSAANAASPGTFTLSPTTVQAGSTVVLTGSGFGDLSGSTNPVTIINFETPAPSAAPPGGAVGGGGNPGTNGGTILVTRTIPASVGAWTYTLTIPTATPTGSGYNVCAEEEDHPGIGDYGCQNLTVTAAATPTSTPTSTPTPTPTPTPTHANSITVTPQAVAGGTLVYSGAGFTPGETVDVFAHSTEVLLRAVTADQNGATSGTVIVPKSLPLGAHTLELRGMTSGLSLTAPFTLGVVPSAATDVVVPFAKPANLWVAGSAALLMIGAAATLTWRRKRAAA